MRRTILALAIVVAAFGVCFGVLASGGWRVVELQGHSMEPAIASGSLLLVRDVPIAQLNVGDVVLMTAESPTGANVTVAHRIQQTVVRSASLVAFTKGDANPITDHVPAVFEQTAPRVELIFAHGQTVLRYALIADLVVLALMAYCAVARRIMGLDVESLIPEAPRRLHLHGK